MAKEQLRDQLAGLAMQSLLSKSEAANNPEYYSIEISNICKWSYIIADQMLQARISKQYVYSSTIKTDKIIKNSVIQEDTPN